MKNARSRPGSWTTGPVGAVLLDALENGGERHEEDLEIQREGPVLDVVVVPLHAIAQGGLPAQAVHLRPSGDSRLDAMAVGVTLDAGAEQVYELGALRPRPHEAHVAPDDVDELGELIEAGASHERSHARAPVEALDTARPEV